MKRGDRVEIFEGLPSTRGLRGTVFGVGPMGTFVNILPDQWDRKLCGIPIDHVRAISAVEQLGDLARSSIRLGGQPC